MKKNIPASLVIFVFMITFISLSCDDKDKFIIADKTSSTKSAAVDIKDLIIRPCVTFCFDGAYKSEIEIIAPLFEKYGIKATSFVETSTIGEKGIMTQSQLLELQNKYGWEIGSHTINHPSLPSLSTEQIESELRDSKEILTGMGFRVNNVAYPNGEFDERVMAISRKYYNTGSKTMQDEVTNGIPLNTYQLIRASSNDGTTFEDYKIEIDYAIKNQRWFIIYGHGFQYTPSTLILLQNLIKYIKSKPIDILTIQKGYERFANKIDFGFQGRNKYVVKDKNSFNYLGQYYYIDAINQINSSYLKTNIRQSTQTLIEYPKNKITIFNVDLTESSDYPNKQPGVLETYNFGVEGLDRQEFFQFSTNSLWVRFPISYSGNWNSWIKIK